MKAELGWKLATIAVAVGVIACGADNIMQRKKLNECRAAVAEQKAALDELKEGIQKMVAARPPRGDMRRRGNFQPPSGENGNFAQPPEGFQPPTDENGDPLPPPDGFAAQSGDDNGSLQNAPRRPRRRTAAPTDGSGTTAN